MAETTNPPKEVIAPILGGNTVEREYTKLDIDPAEAAAEIPEPVMARPSLDELEAEFYESDAGEIYQTAPKTENEPLQQERSQTSYSEPKNLDKKTRKKGAERTAMIALDGYGKLKGLMGNFVKIKKDTLEQEFAEGTIDRDISIPIDENTAIPINDFVEEFNNEVEEAFKITEDFKEEVFPVLVEVFEQHNIQISATAQLAYLLIADMGQTLAQGYVFHSTKKGILENLRVQTEMLRNAYEQPRPNSQPNPPQKEPEFKEPDNSAVEDTQEAAFEIVVDQNNEFQPAQQPAGAPQFGDKKILSEIDKIAKENGEKTTKRRTTTKRASTTRNKKQK